MINNVTNLISGFFVDINLTENQSTNEKENDHE